MTGIERRPAVPLIGEPPAFRKREFNYDAHGIDWPWTDPEFARRVGDRLLATLDRLESDASIRRVVVVTHVPLLECQICRKPHQRDWGYSNAYFGNLTLGRAVLARPKVTYIVSGHTHVPREGVVELGGRTVAARILAGDYGRPGWYGLTLGPI